MCGIAAVKLKDKGQADKVNVLYLLMLALYQMNHRGQDGTGYVWVVDDALRVHKGFGYAKEEWGRLVKSIDERMLRTHQALGHLRYRTEGSVDLAGLQPAVAETVQGRVFALADNGNLVNYQEERRRFELSPSRFRFSSGNEAELILRAIVHHHLQRRMQVNGAEVDFVESIKWAINYFRGAFSAVLMTRNNIFAFIDKHNFRPLWLGEHDNFWVIASETCALDILLIPTDRRTQLQAGQIAHINEQGDLRIFQVENTEPRHCIFELIYFSRPDSVLWGQLVGDYRRKLGKTLACYDKQKNVNADIVVPVPDSANDIAYGYAEESGVKLEPWALIRNHYVGRTFIKPEQAVRDNSVREKFNPRPGVFQGKSVVLIDDSIVRGTTIIKIIKMVLQAGARAVHLRIGSPPKVAPCFYGIATPTYEEHIVYRLGSVEAFEKYIKEQIKDYLTTGAGFTLQYLELKDLYSTVDQKDFCFACFDENYPV